MLRMSDIAARAGVSSSTVSFVLNDRHTAVRISEETRQRVLAAAEELGYRPNHLARAMRTGNTQMLGFMGGDLRTEQMGCMVAGALEEADRSGYTLKLLPHQQHEDGSQAMLQMIRRSSQLRLMGVLALHMPLPLLEQLHAEAQQYHYPLVLVDTRAPIEGLAQVVSDDEGGVAQAIAHLVQLGHRRLAMIAGEEISTLTPLRTAAYKTAMQRHGLEAPEGSIVHGDYRFHEPSFQAARAVLDQAVAKRPTAIFCAGDWIALAALQCAAQLGLQVPRDLSIVGFADLSVSQFSTPPLTTIQQPFQEMGCAAVKRLLALRDDNQDDPGGDLEMLPTRLIERASTAPPLKSA